jgi:hypothetical protein
MEDQKHKGRLMIWKIRNTKGRLMIWKIRNTKGRPALGYTK